MRKRTETEKNYIWEKVYNQCIKGGHPTGSAKWQADHVLEMLPEMTPQPMSAADWLRGRTVMDRWAA